MADTQESGSSIPDFKPPSRAPMWAAGFGGLVLGGVVAAGVMTYLGSPLKKPARSVRAAAVVCPSVCPSASAAPGASASVAPPVSSVPKDPLTVRAAAGDPEAVKTLESRSPGDRSAADVVALSRAKAADKRRALTELGRKIGLVPKLLDDPATNKTLRLYAVDAEVAPDLVLMLAELPGPAGPDALYKFGPTAYPKTEASALAEEVLYAKDVRAKASSALGVVLDLRREEDCKKVAKLLEKVKTEGDKRALPALGRLQKKTGCGPKQRDDCWACLRKPDLIKEAAKEASKRKGP